MKKYYLMHKDTVCGTVVLDEYTGKIDAYRDRGTGASPFLGTADLQKIKKWWEMRAIPASRTIIRELIKQSKCINPEDYLAKNLALSMTDNYWINPAGSDITYDMVKFQNLIGYNQGKIACHSASSYDTQASLGGQMEKYWDLKKEKPVLVKESYKYYGQQSINEVFATKLHSMLGEDVPYVSYISRRTADNGTLCMCEAFTTENVEFIPAIEVVESKKLDSSVSAYDSYIKICTDAGIPEEAIQKYMDYQTITDFVISNTDEHLMNFGILRDSDTMKIIGPAPIFDSGNSMFYSEGTECRYNRANILERPITSFYNTEEKMISKIKNRNVIDTDRLPSKDWVIDFYTQNGIPEEKAVNIAANYGIKVELVKEMQKGKKISVYLEKQKEKGKRAPLSGKGNMDSAVDKDAYEDNYDGPDGSDSFEGR